MEIRQLSAFVAVAEEGTFTRAADCLGVVQPAVSQAVGRLEAELGLLLFQRSSRRVTLTSAGAALLPEARAVLSRLAQAERTAADLAAGRSGVVRLATTPGASGLVGALLTPQRAAPPGVRVELAHARRGPKLRALLDGEIDVALVHSAPRTPGLAFTEVWREPWRPVVSAAHLRAGSDPVDLRALAGDPLVTVERDGSASMREQFVGLCRGAGFEPTFGATFGGLSDAVVEIAQSSAWTLLRASNARNLEPLGLVALPSATSSHPPRCGSRTAAIPH